MVLGIFDSGIGGLSILDAISETLPELSTIYLADQHHFPYGTKDPQTLIDYAIESATFLLDQGANALLIACHTASAYALNALTERFSLPIFGMVEPTVKCALGRSQKGRIALLGTEATIRSGVYEAADTSAEIIPLAMQELINAIEAKQVTKDLLMNSLARIRATGADTVILACTHFAHIEKEIQASLGDKVHLINPAHAVANDIREKLGPMPDAPSTQRFFSSSLQSEKNSCAIFFSK